MSNSFLSSLLWSTSFVLPCLAYRLVSFVLFFPCVVLHISNMTCIQRFLFRFLAVGICTFPRPLCRPSFPLLIWTSIWYAWCSLRVSFSLLHGPKENWFRHYRANNQHWFRFHEHLYSPAGPPEKNLVITLFRTLSHFLCSCTIARSLGYS